MAQDRAPCPRVWHGMTPSMRAYRTNESKFGAPLGARRRRMAPCRTGPTRAAAFNRKLPRACGRIFHIPPADSQATHVFSISRPLGLRVSFMDGPPFFFKRARLDAGAGSPHWSGGRAAPGRCRCRQHALARRTQDRSRAPARFVEGAARGRPDQAAAVLRRRGLCQLRRASGTHAGPGRPGGLHQDRVRASQAEPGEMIAARY